MKTEQRAVLIQPVRSVISIASKNTSRTANFYGVVPRDGLRSGVPGQLSPLPASKKTPKGASAEELQETKQNRSNSLCAKQVWTHMEHLFHVEQIF
jgi:hypothetical protein